MEPDEALEKILSSSGLQSNALPNGAYTVTLAAAAAQEPARGPFRMAQRSEEETVRPVETRTGPVVAPARATAPMMRAGSTRSSSPPAGARKAFRTCRSRCRPLAATNSLTASRSEGGAELLRAVPNVSFTKTNFSMYNFSIRGVGTSAISAASDPGVAISFNNTPLIRNRLFEQEYYDVNRVEVLRGPQGTLYGRNATAGVVNLIPNVASTEEFEGFIRGEVGNFDTRRLSAMVNVPVTDEFALRFAGALTDRSGFDLNTFTGARV